MGARAVAVAVRLSAVLAAGDVAAVRLPAVAVRGLAGRRAVLGVLARRGRLRDRRDVTAVVAIGPASGGGARRRTGGVVVGALVAGGSRPAVALPMRTVAAAV